MNGQLTVQESRHKLARDICHGKRGQIMHAYRQGQEDQLGALGLVLNAAVLWTTRYLDAAVTKITGNQAERTGGVYSYGVSVTLANTATLKDKTPNSCDGKGCPVN